ncbi:hypothetical protein HPB50_014364 [Hyalomma asiaticum]|uniref:Uncharacterized protein n=1 Tax=Hyalomma asiaticum TaxID=266040 RepID=A0ACB7SHF2_HYAAI|nr:hypothetical protein HPB50_014364 [Hyalomma asiaticum]
MLIDILQKVLPCDIVLAFPREQRTKAMRSDSSDGTQAASESASAAASSDAKLKALLAFVRVELKSREQCMTPIENAVNDLK